MPGSSFFKIIRKEQYLGITGRTGSTGPTGPTGPVGYGPTGPTGLGISYIGLSFGKLINYFTDGTSFITGTTFRGPTGNTVSPIKTSISGSGVSIISSKPASNEIIFRSIKGSTSNTGKSEIKITESGNTLTIEVLQNASGISLINVSSDFYHSFAGTTGSGLSLTNIRDTNYDPTDGSSIFGVKNVFEKARGLGYTGATQYISGITCNYYYDDKIDEIFTCKTVRIDPSCKSSNSVDYMTTNKVYFIDMEFNYGKIIIGNPISSRNSTAFTLIVKNARNSPVGTEKRFQSFTNSIQWPFGIEPCFGGYGETDVYHFYSLFDSWFGSVVYSSKFNGLTFDCSRTNQQPLQHGACCHLDPCPPLTDIIELSAGKYFNAVQTSKGKIKLWGGPVAILNLIETAIPSDYKSYKISTNQHALYSLGTSGGITGWGLLVNNYDSIPSGFGYTAIAIAPSHGLALNSTGGVTCWRFNNIDSGQCNIPAGLSNVKQIAVGYNHSMALKHNGDVVCWGGGIGSFYENQCDNIPSGVSFTSIAGYDFGGIGIAKGNTVYAWGTGPVATSVPSGLTAEEISGSMDYDGIIGNSVAVARVYNGTLIGWGNSNAISTFFRLPGYTASKISVGYKHALAISNNEVKAWGQNVENVTDVICGDCGVTCSYKTYEDCSGLQGIFRGVGSECLPTTCEITGPCCMSVGCQDQSDVYTSCFPGVTYSNCICGGFSGAVSNANFVFDDTSTECTCQEDSVCPGVGICCKDGSCYDNYTFSLCQQEGGDYKDGTTCQLNPNFCKLGRCCHININNVSSTYCTNTISSRCTTTTNYLANWLESGNCQTNKCILKGACCNGSCNGCCDYPSYEFPEELSYVYQYIQNYDNICGLGFSGSFMGDNTKCTTPCPTINEINIGACVIIDCPNSVNVVDNVTLQWCSSQPTYTKFYPNITKRTLGKFCVRLIDSDENPTGWACYSDNTTNLINTISVNSLCVLEPGSYYESSFFPNEVCCTQAGGCCSYPDNSIKTNVPTDSLVVANYRPYDELLLGKDFKQCCPTTFDDLLNGDEVEAQNYRSKFDWFGYGFTFAKNSDDIASNMSFRLYVYPKDLYYSNEDGTIIKEVIWGQSDGKCAWGPRVEKNIQGNYVLNDIKTQGLEYEYYKDEGYWQITKANYPVEILLSKTYRKQPQLQFSDGISALVINDDSTFSNNGAWRRNWGLYNTMRMMGADNAYYALRNPIINVDYYLPDEWTPARLVDKLNSEIDATPNSSSWFIPSMDEMAFICKNLSSLESFLEDPIEGDYWTSTGAFDESTSEGKKTTPKSIANPGEQAWAFSIEKVFNQNGEYVYDIRVRKENRKLKLKVRAIRIELVNSDDVPLSGTEEHKLWKLQPLKWVRERI